MSSRRLLLDIDGVLHVGRPDFESHMRSLGWKGEYQVFQNALFLDEEYRATLVGRADIRMVLGRLLREFDQELGLELLMRQWLGGNLLVNEELLALLPSLQVHSIRLATNQDPVRAAGIRRMYRDRPAIAGMYFSHEIGHRKPFAEYFAHITADLDCAPEDIVFVDDSPENVEGAREFGMSAVRFADNESLLRQLSALGIGRGA